MQGKWKVDKFAGHDKVIALQSPCGVSVFVDYDDVDHKAVRKLVKEMLKKLNA